MRFRPPFLPATRHPSPASSPGLWLRAADEDVELLGHAVQSAFNAAESTLHSIQSLLDLLDPGPLLLDLVLDLLDPCPLLLDRGVQGRGLPHHAAGTADNGDQQAGDEHADPLNVGEMRIDALAEAD